MSGRSGYSLVELMVVSAIVAILAAVAIPAYINHINRAKQSEALEVLLRARMSQEVFWSENGRYANTIGCLQTFGGTCSRALYRTSSTTVKSYLVSISGQTIMAQRVIAGAGTDVLWITPGDPLPTISDPEKLGFSIFKWLFE